MGFSKNMRSAWEVYFHPSKVAKSKMDVGSALKYYYQNTIIPALIFIAIGSVIIGLGANNIGPTISGANLIEITGIASLIFGLLYFWVIAPISIFINAFIYQIVGYNLLKVLKPDYEKSFTAVMLGELPTMLMYWLVAIPIAGMVALIVLSIWSIVVFIISLAEQHRIKRTESVIVLLATSMLILIFAVVIFSVMYSFILGGIFGSVSRGIGAGVTPMYP